jgi:predicted transport protein
MPLFEIKSQCLKPVERTNFNLEKELQSLIEKNLEVVFNCRFVASEFTTGQTHAGRIDSLALSEENNPVIIEYKKVESSELINQSLYYLNWINDHKGDFQVAVQKVLGNSIKVDWSDIRVICIAPNYRKYDLHAVQVMGANIELWNYRLFENSILYFEQVYGNNTAVSATISESQGKNPVMVAAGKKAAITRATASYTFEQHIKGKSKKVIDLTMQIQEYILSLDPAISENPKKFYIGYKTSQNIVCVEVRTQKVTLYIKLNPKNLQDLPEISRDVTEIGHYGTGDLEITIQNEADFKVAKQFIEMAYKKIGS